MSDEIEQEEVRNTFTVPERNLPYLMEQIEKLNKRCKRIGIPLIGVDKEHSHYTHQFVDEFLDLPKFSWVHEKDLNKPRSGKPTGQIMPWHLLTIHGEAPKYAGWKFVATLEPKATDDGGLNLIMAVPGESCPTHYMKAENVGWCDHCKKHRRRSQTFVVRHESGEYKAIGRSCLKDFLGHADPKKLAQWAELLASLTSLGGEVEDEEFAGSGFRAPQPSYNLEWFLGWVAGVTRVHGWMSRGRARVEERQSTVERIFWLLDPPMFSGRNAAHDRAEWQEDKDKCEPTEADQEFAKEAMAWAKGLDLAKLMDDSGENYLANIAALAQVGVVDHKTAGLGGSIVSAFAKDQERKLREAERNKGKAESKHLGAEKERGTYRVRIERIIPRQGDFGVTYITGMIAWDEERKCYANDMTWFASGEHDLEQGCEYEIKATVKRHGEFQGRAQTQVNRVKVIEVLKDQEDPW